MRIKLSRLQRLLVVLSVIYLIIIIFVAWNKWPMPKRLVLEDAPPKRHGFTPLGEATSGQAAKQKREPRDLLQRQPRDLLAQISPPQPIPTATPIEIRLPNQNDIEILLPNPNIDRLKIVGIAFLAWIIPSGIVYLLVISIGWICRGFKENKTSTKILYIEETKKNMNKKQRAIIIGGIVAIIIMFLFPPYAIYVKHSKIPRGYGSHVNYVLKPSNSNEVIDIGTLSIQYVTIIIIGSLLWILARDTKLKDNLNGDQEKTK